MRGSTPRNVVLIVLALMLLTLPNFFAFHYGDYAATDIVKTELLSVAFICIPLVLFVRNLKLYGYLLTLFAFMAPLVIFSIITYHLEPGFEFFTLILQTNLKEVAEITQGHRLLMFLSIAASTAAYLICIRKITVKKTSVTVGLVISVLAVAVVVLKLRRDWQQGGKAGVTAKVYRYYPASVINGVADVLPFIRNNNLDRAANFSFHARSKDSIQHRKVFVFIIGESSRLSKWQLYGYDKPTSPQLSKRAGVTAFGNVAAAANTTMFAVPQMITRATPDDMDRQYREKSIVSLFKEAGFKTVWLSNQPNHDAFWSGSILLHAQTADVAYFPPTAFPYTDVDSYDGRYLPVLDSIINSTRENLFVVIHTMGSHWDYSKRYPQPFEYFKPANTYYDPNAPVNTFTTNVLNAYDNSILYTDFFVDSVIGIANKYNTNSFVAYCADHGEYLFDSTNDHTVNHLKPSEITLHVPMLVWTSEMYNQTYPAKTNALLKNKNQPISACNLFSTLGDMADLSFDGFDSTTSFANDHFKGSEQSFFVNDTKGVAYFKDLH